MVDFDQTSSKSFRFPRSYDLAEKSEPEIYSEDLNNIMDIINRLHLKNRSLITDGYDEAVEFLGGVLPFNVISFPTGYEAFTWTVPEKWTVNKAKVTFDGKVICDVSDHPLHLVSYSLPFKGTVDKSTLLEHLHTDPDRPYAIPYVYKYYSRDWGMCVPYSVYKNLPEGNYEVDIDTEFNQGNLKVAEYVIPGETEESIIFSAHLDHPGQVNDGLGGVALGIELFKKIQQIRRRRYTYRLVILPENIGSACYLHHYRNIYDSFKYAVFLEMVVSKGRLTLQRSRQSSTDLDKLAEISISKYEPVFGIGDFRQVICNDEINFNGPQIDIPTVTITRWPYPEYHTSDDNPGLVSLKYTEKTLNICWDLVGNLEANTIPAPTYTGNLRLGKFDLYENLNIDDTVERFMLSMDGNNSLLDISEKLNISFERSKSYLERFEESGLVQ